MTGVCDRTLANLIDDLGSSLNDLEGKELYRIAVKQGIANPQEDTSVNHVRWSEYFLTSAINDAFRLIHLERPDLFVNNVRFKLKPGCTHQPLPEGCTRFAGSLENSTSCSSVSTPTKMSSTQIETANRLSGLFCGKSTGNEKYSVQSYGFDPKKPNEFTVIPSVPSGVDAYVTIGCVGSPPCFDWDQDKDAPVEGDASMMDTYEIVVIEYALYRAYSVDHESESSKEIAALHWERSLTLIKEGKATDYFFHHPDLYLIGSIAEGSSDVLRNQQG